MKVELITLTIMVYFNISIVLCKSYYSNKVSMLTSGVKCQEIFPLSEYIISNMRTEFQSNVSTELLI